jgi:DNA-binding XRE family transcriptional regulator
MQKTKKSRLKAKGWRFGSATEFLNLSPEETAYLEVKIGLSRMLQNRRRQKRVTQYQLAKMLRSSQSRVAKMEAGDPSVSLDLLVRTLLVLGVPKKSIFQALPI